MDIFSSLSGMFSFKSFKCHCGLACKQSYTIFTCCAASLSWKTAGKQDMSNFLFTGVIILGLLMLLGVCFAAGVLKSGNCGMDCVLVDWKLFSLFAMGVLNAGKLGRSLCLFFLGVSKTGVTWREDSCCSVLWRVCISINFDFIWSNSVA